MKYTSDQDGKSKTASAVDQDHYPEQHEVKNQNGNEHPYPVHDEIASRARQLWEKRGRPHGSAEQDWLQAEEELRAASGPRSGSVQR